MKQWRKFSQFFSFVWRISPSLVFLVMATALLPSAQAALNMFLPKLLIDELTGACRAQSLLLYGGAIVGSNVGIALLQNVVKRGRSVRSIYVTHMTYRAIAEKSMKLPFANLESAKCLDLKERAIFGMVNQDALYDMIDSVAVLLQSIATILTALVVLLGLSPILVLLLIACIAGNLAAQAKMMQAQLAHYQSLIPVNRKFEYYLQLCAESSVQKDVRLYGMRGLFMERIRMYMQESTERMETFMKKNGRFEGFCSILNDLQSALAYGYAGLRVLGAFAGKAPVSLGSLTMYVSAAASFSKSATELGAQAVRVVAMLGYLDPFLEFMALPDQASQSGARPFPGQIDSISFEHVSFRYPESDAFVLRDVSFEIHGGEKISIVGLNGAGKTTLVKLLCRLYEPQEGRICINGVDILEYDREQYLAAVAAVFQDYKLFAFSIDENITGKQAGSDLVGSGSVIRRVGLGEKMAELDDGIYTLIGKNYDEKGIELSGGERQKIAIARALYKNAPLVILDEPTSALDPLAEAEIYENFNALIGDKTALYISHRMSSSVFCDRILLLENGTVAAFDTHAALMQKKDGLYYKLFDAQAKNYRKEG